MYFLPIMRVLLGATSILYQARQPIRQGCGLFEFPLCVGRWAVKRVLGEKAAQAKSAVNAAKEEAASVANTVVALVSTTGSRQTAGYVHLL